MMGNRGAIGRDEIMRKSTIAIGLAATLAALGALAPSAAPAAPAQESPARTGLHRRPPLRIEVTPSRQVQRQCVDWHVIEHRASGDTIVPRSHCWWVSR
jgi:hypothetical protein